MKLACNVVWIHLQNVSYTPAGKMNCQYFWSIFPERLYIHCKKKKRFI